MRPESLIDDGDLLIHDGDLGSLLTCAATHCVYESEPDGEPITGEGRGGYVSLAATYAIQQATCPPNGMVACQRIEVWPFLSVTSSPRKRKTFLSKLSHFLTSSRCNNHPFGREGTLKVVCY